MAVEVVGLVKDATSSYRRGGGVENECGACLWSVVEELLVRVVKNH